MASSVTTAVCASLTSIVIACADCSCWVPAPFQPNCGSSAPALAGMKLASCRARSVAVAGLKFRYVWANSRAKALPRPVGNADDEVAEDDDVPFELAGDSLSTMATTPR